MTRYKVHITANGLHGLYKGKALLLSGNEKTILTLRAALDKMRKADK